MGCNNSAPGSKGGGARQFPTDGKECGPQEKRLREHEAVFYKPDEDCYYLRQAFAIVRHADRLDHTDAWMTAKENETLRSQWPNDTPLLRPKGFEHAKQVGELLKKTGTKFGLIVASPYFRCAQTASCIAQVLKVPVHFDLDLGEVFDNVSMKGDIAGKPQHRNPVDLEKGLKPDFPDVEYVRGDDNKLKVEGSLQTYPEEFKLARMRYCYKTKKLVQKASDELMSIVIVTHGDALAAVVNLMRENWKIGKVDYTAWAHCTRETKVYDRSLDEVVKDLPVYVNPDDWTIKLSNTFTTTTVTPKGPNAKEKADKKHEQHLKEMNDMGKQIQTSYTLDDKHIRKLKTALSGLNAHETEHDEMLLAEQRVANRDAEHGEAERIKCAPHEMGESNQA